MSFLDIIEQLGNTVRVFEKVGFCMGYSEVLGQKTGEEIHTCPTNWTNALLLAG